MYRALIISSCCVIILMWLLVLAPGIVRASSGPASTEELYAGPYLIDINFSQDPPFTDQAFDVTVVPHNNTLRLSGQIIAQPGLGTDAVNLYAPLIPVVGAQGTLKGSLRLPVKGAWQIVAQTRWTSGACHCQCPCNGSGTRGDAFLACLDHRFYACSRDCLVGLAPAPLSS